MNVFDALPRRFSGTQCMRQHFDRARRLRRKILIDDEIQPSVLQILARMRRQIVTDNVNAPIGFARSSASIQPRTDSFAI